MEKRLTYRAEMLLVLFTMAIAVLGFWTIYIGADADPQPHHHLHLATTFAWMGLLLTQLVFLARARHALHRRLGLAVMIAAPLLFASVALLTVHSAHRGIVSGEGDFLIVQNVVGTFWLAAVLAIAFVVRKRRKLHGAFLMSSLLLFLGPALFFALLAFAPPFRIEGPDTFYRFGTAAMTGQGIIAAIALFFFVKDWRNNWPYLLAAASFAVAEGIKAMLTQAGQIDALTRAVGEINRGWAFALSFLLMMGILAANLRARPATRRRPLN